MKTKIRHGNSEPLPGNLCQYQLGFSDLNNHLYIKNGHDEIIDIMGWISAGTGKKVDTLQDFFGEIVWRMYFEGVALVSNTSITIPNYNEVKDENNDNLYVTNIVNYGGNAIVQYNGSTTVNRGKVLMPIGYEEYIAGNSTKLPVPTNLNTVSLVPIAIVDTSDKYRLWFVTQTHSGSAVNEPFTFGYRVYVDFTDGSVRTQQ
jgi:hypothetical protein